MATPVGAEHRDIEQRFRDIERALAESNTATLRRQPQRGQAVQYDLNSTDLSTGFTEVVSARQTITVPSGYTRASVLLFVSAGVSSTGAGATIVGVYPIVAGVGGPAISNGVPGPGSVSSTSFYASNLSNLTGGSTFLLQVQAYSNASNTITSGSGNVHLSASITFLR